MSDKKQLKTIPFKLAGIVTKQFAIIESAYKKDGKTAFSTRLGFGLNPQHHVIEAGAKFEFQQKNTTFLLIEVGCQFNIEKTVWDKMISGKQLVVPNGFAQHMQVITIGTTRGVLHAKTENTPYNKFLIPTVDVTQLIKEDFPLNLKMVAS